jgi:hypothetical protein
LLIVRLFKLIAERRRNAAAQFIHAGNFPVLAHQPSDLEIS